MDDSVKRELDVAIEASKRAKLIAALQAEFPDLRVAIDRWDHKRFCSKSVNGRADKVDFRFNCGCCSDSPCEARPYIETMGTQIFADPDRYVIGERCDSASNYRAVSESPGWDEAMRRNGVSQTAIDMTRKYLDATTPRFDEDEEPEPII